MGERIPCDYQKPGVARYGVWKCLNAARWEVEYTSPDDGKGMRQRALAHRCSSHTASKFFPDGATQITTALIDTARAIPSEGERP